ncbi:hypothetical protein SLEP1_g42624 [Rubroshorea leprosula]|uniref:AT3G52170-like helix-turn-helix domain-containing protein n=1 Tax=Rubroshorea leprosula TaxID=152421 RepID=A0AAV5LAP4_9ROSI|nr:hypothetical protein SLEP1_g42624 [Rubroshorea leprosula]
MHAIKGAWVGQTFALAKSNESGGRKARIRRSKEERKVMVESFIKKYQSTNDGNFPSLNLTHKEVGGSFYTIREIVREIIQENRVLGPGKLIEEEENAEQFLEQHPLGSISIELQSSQSIPTSGINFVPNHDQDVNDESEHEFDNEQIINVSAMDLKDETDTEVRAEFEGNGTSIDLKDKSDKEVGSVEVNGSAMDLKDESAKEVSAELGVAGIGMDLKDESDKEVGAEVKVELFEESGKELTSPTSRVTPVMAEAEESGKQFTPTTSKVTQLTTDAIVETFPLRPVSTFADYIDERSGEVRILSETSEETQIKKVGLGPENGNSISNGIISSEKNNAVMLEKNSDSPLEVSKQLTTTDSVEHGSQNGATSKVDVLTNDILTSKTNERSKVTDGEVTSFSNGIHPKTDDTLPVNFSVESATQEEIVVKKNRANVQHNANSQKASNATLDRTKFESREGTAKGNAASKTNPLLAFFNSFIATFVKFWSE